MADRDFTFKMYDTLLCAFQNQHYEIVPFREYPDKQITGKLVILRHDVDKNPGNALKCAEIERDYKIRSTYYFRIVKTSFNPDVIRKIENMGHEIGYHYEDLALAKGNIDKAIKLFSGHINVLRQTATIQTICSHGNPLSRWNNLVIWEKYNYRDFKVTGEPFFDLDFSKVYYLTDTGRRWDAYYTNIRDKVETPFHLPIKKTKDIIRHLETGELPDILMLNMHPQRWNDNYFRWGKELIWQNIKNQVKRLFAEKL
jgi:hypothetical protein